jgi:hypothetical protein
LPLDKSLSETKSVWESTLFGFKLIRLLCPH